MIDKLIPEIEYDYEVLHECDYPVPAFNESMETNCGEPATHKVWWSWAEDGIYSEDTMIVCPEHLQTIIKQEVKDA